MPTQAHPILRVDDETFDHEVLEAQVPVLVDFVARWCGPCRVMAPVVERLAAENGDRLKVVTVDTDESPGIAHRYGVRAVPTVMVFLHGKKTASHLGTATKEKLLGMVTAQSATAS
jgi:thioredoxin 1